MLGPCTCNQPHNNNKKRYRFASDSRCETGTSTTTTTVSAAGTGNANTNPGLVECTCGKVQLTFTNVSHITRRATCSIKFPCLSDADLCLHSDVMPGSHLQDKPRVHLECCCVDCHDWLKWAHGKGGLPAPPTLDCVYFENDFTVTRCVLPSATPIHGSQLSRQPSTPSTVPIRHDHPAHSSDAAASSWLPCSGAMYSSCQPDPCRHPAPVMYTCRLAHILMLTPYAARTLTSQIPTSPVAQCTDVAVERIT